MRTLLGRLCLGAALLLGTPLLAQEKPPLPDKAERGEAAKCKVRIIHALQTAGEVDGRLSALKDQLTRPPLSSFRSFKLLMEHDLKLGPERPATFQVPGDHEGVLSYQGQTSDPKRKRVRLRLEFKDGSAKLMSTVFLIDDGGTVLHGGIKHEGGVLVTGITCRLHGEGL